MWAEQLPSGKVRFCERYVMPDGTSKRVSCTLDKDNASTRKIASQILQQKAYAIKPTALTFGELCALYLSDQERTVKLSTLKRNSGCLNRLKSILGENTASESITAGYVRRCLLDTGKSATTLNEYIKRLKAMMHWAYKMDYVSHTLDKLDKFPDTPHRVKIEDKFLESSEVTALMDAMTNERWRRVTEFLVLSGLRFGECAALKRSDVDLSRRIITVTKTYDEANKTTTAPKTPSSNRELYIQDELLTLCRMILNDPIDISGLFFSYQSHEISYAAYRKYLTDISAKVLGRSITPHTLRHTHASLMLEAGLDVDTISARLGHADSAVTREIYLHVTERLQAQRNEAMREVHLFRKAELN